MNASLTQPLTFHPPQDDGPLAKRLRAAVKGDVLFDRASRGRKRYGRSAASGCAT